MKALTHAVIFTGDEVITGKAVLVEYGKIIDISVEIPRDAEIIDLSGKNIAPGFIDIQLNGGYDRYFSHQPDFETLDDMRNASAGFATPYFLTTLISAPAEKILKALDVVRNYMKLHPEFPGMHLEGPFINTEKKGAHSADIIRKPTDDELKKIIDKGRGVIKVMTIAPECFTEYQLDMLMDTGIVLSAGHSAMTYEQAIYFFGKGIHLVTHLFNAMTQMGHREPGIVGAVFDSPDVYAPLILDGGHCHYGAARTAWRQKQDKLILLSDSSFLGRRKTRFDWEGLNIEMVDGYYRDKSGNLAGAAISMPEAIKNAVAFLGVSLQEAVEMSTARVAKAIRMHDKIGFIRKGYPAHFAVFDNDLDDVKTLRIH